MTLGGDSVRPGDQIRNPEDLTDREPKRLHVAGGTARAASVPPRKRGSGRFFAAVLARPRQRLGPGVSPLAPFPLVPINTPFGGSSRGYLESLGSLCYFVFRVIVVAFSSSSNLV